MAAVNLSRYRLLMERISASVIGRDIDGISNEAVNKKIRLEYVLLLVIFISGGLFAFANGLSVEFVLFWIIPAVLIAEPVHFLIETPEHYGLNTQSNPDVLKNTWTIESPSRLAYWITNGNNLHTAHHFHPGVPMQNVTDLHQRIDEYCEAKKPNYFRFYRDLINGAIQHQATKSAMKR